MTDKTAPKLISASPQKSSTAIAVNQDVVLTFNKAIQLGTGSIIISNGSDDTRIIAIPPPISQGEINVSGTKFTLNPAKDLLPNSHYTVKIDDTAIQDSSGNKYAGIKNTTTLFFDTVDKRAPSLKASLANTSNIASNSNIILAFDEKIQAGTGNITLVSDNDSRTIAIADKQVKISGNTLTINPSVDLNIGSTYKVHLDAGAIKDLAPLNNNNKAIDLSFTTKATGDKQAPVLQSYAGNGSIGNKLQLAFQEHIKIGKGSFTLVNSANNKDKIVIPITDASVSITNHLLTIDFTGSTKIIPTNTYLLTAPKGIVTDLAKNAFAGLTTNKHISYHDETSPTITITDDKTTTTNSTILYTFTISETVKDFTADNIKVAGGIKDKFTSVSASSYTLSVTPDKNSTTPVTVDVAVGKFSDAAGNSNVAAVQNEQAIDTKAPQLTSVSPLDTGINVAKNSNIVLTFDGKVIAGTGNLVVSNGTDTQTISVKDSTQVSIIDNLLTINPTNDLLENSNYTVTIASGVLSDSLGNAFAGLTSKFKTVAPITANDVVLTAKAIDGYLKNAIVFADANGNGKQDPDEASTTTDENGNFKLVNAKGPINISGGTDLSTGKPFAGTLKAPEGSTVVTPLTSVQQGFIEAGQTPAQAEQSVAKAFGFDASKVDLTTYDPIAEVVKAGATGVTSSIIAAQMMESSAQMMASSAQIANFLVTAGQVLQGAAGGSGNLSTQSASDALIKSLVTAISNDATTGNGTINLGDATLLKTVLVEGAKEANTQAQKQAQETGTTAPKFDAAIFTDKIDKMADTVTAVLKSAADNITKAVNNSKGGDALTLLGNMDKVSTFAQNDAGASLQKIATTLDTKNIASLTTALKSQSDLFTGDAATKSIESKVVETQKAVADVVAAADKIAADKAAADKIAADKAAADKIAADKAAADKIAADKAAADKIAADKAAADKIAADKATADKIAADKAAADKIAADKAAADKIAADKAAADKIAADKEVADKAAADKIAADKAAADKAATDKIAADKAAADKAATDKIAADKAAADKAAADKIAADKAAADKIAADKAAAEQQAINDAQQHTTPSTDITVSNSGNTDASTAKTTFNFLTGNYTYSIVNYSADDSLIFPMGQTITVKNEDLTDKKVELHWASKGNEITVVLTGLTADQDKALLFASDVSKQFGSTALTYKTSAPTPNNTAQNITISTDGSQNATIGNIAFNILAGDYNFTIADFSTGDSLHFPTGNKPSVLNTSFIDGKADLHWTSIDGQDAIITLTGLTDAQDKAILFTTSFDTLFGANTLSYT